MMNVYNKFLTKWKKIKEIFGDIEDLVMDYPELDELIEEYFMDNMLDIVNGIDCFVEELEEQEEYYSIKLG